MVIVSGNSVERYLAAIQAQVDEHELAARFLREHIVFQIFQGQPHWFHSGPAIGPSISGSFQVNMLGPETQGTVVSMLRAPRNAGNDDAAVQASFRCLN